MLDATDSMITTIGVIYKSTEPEVVNAVDTVCTLLDELGINVIFDKLNGNAPEVKKRRVVTRGTLGQVSDMCIVIGGDGTMLSVVRYLVNYDIPILGINLGHLGFLADISPTNISKVLDSILKGDCTEESRSLLKVHITRDGELLSESCAFNDVVVHKWNGSRALEFETYVDDTYINTAHADGLIVATPTGSTGYALSGGGPILHPSLFAIVIVPICPHSMTFRPIVVHANAEINIVIQDCNQLEAQVSCDGQINFGLQAHDIITIARFENPIRLIHPSDYDYYSILREKLHWGKRLS